MQERDRDLAAAEGDGDPSGVSLEQVRPVVEGYLQALPRSFLSDLSADADSRGAAVNRISRIVGKRVAIPQDQVGEVAAWIEQEVVAILDRHRARTRKLARCAEAAALSARRAQATQQKQ